MVSICSFYDLSDGEFVEIVFVGFSVGCSVFLSVPLVIEKMCISGGCTVIKICLSRSCLLIISFVFFMFFNVVFSTCFISHYNGSSVHFSLTCSQFFVSFKRYLFI